jgi:large subunit ribosomal protein L23
MPDLKYYDVILRPVITEKTMNEMADKKYAFYVHPEATKPQIREAVHKMFEGTKVERVNTMNLGGKKKRTRGWKYGLTAKRKKAIVQLSPDSKDIEIFQGM